MVYYMADKLYQIKKIFTSSRAKLTHAIFAPHVFESAKISSIRNIKRRLMRSIGIPILTRYIVLCFLSF